MHAKPCERSQDDPYFAEYDNDIDHNIIITVSTLVSHAATVYAASCLIGTTATSSPPEFAHPYFPGRSEPRGFSVRGHFLRSVTRVDSIRIPN